MNGNYISPRKNRGLPQSIYPNSENRYHKHGKGCWASIKTYYEKAHPNDFGRYSGGGDGSGQNPIAKENLIGYQGQLDFDSRESIVNDNDQKIPVSAIHNRKERRRQWPNLDTYGQNYEDMREFREIYDVQAPLMRDKHIEPCRKAAPGTDYDTPGGSDPRGDYEDNNPEDQVSNDVDTPPPEIPEDIPSSDTPEPPQTPPEQPEVDHPPTPTPSPTSPPQWGGDESDKIVKNQESLADLKYDDITRPNGRGWENMMDTLVDVSAATGVDPGLLATMAFKESSFDPDAQNPISTASGLFQFTDGTWNYMMDMNADKYGIPRNTPKTDPVANALMAASYAKYNERYLVGSNPGRNLTLTDHYYPHFLGGGGQRHFFNGLHNTPNELVTNGTMLSDQLTANPHVFYHNADTSTPRTYQEVYQYHQSRVNSQMPVVTAYRDRANERYGWG